MDALAALSIAQTVADCAAQSAADLGTARLCEAKIPEASLLFIKQGWDSLLEQGIPAANCWLLQSPDPDAPPVGRRLAGSLLRAEELHKASEEGFTLLAVQLERLSKLFDDLGAQIELAAGQSIQLNGYSTPRPGPRALAAQTKTRGLGRHYDEHDVAVIQVEGKKIWRFPSQGGSSSREISLCAGQMLFVPRGIIHEAFTANTVSLHLSVSFRP